METEGAPTEGWGPKAHFVKTASCLSLKHVKLPRWFTQCGDVSRASHNLLVLNHLDLGRWLPNLQKPIWDNECLFSRCRLVSDWISILFCQRPGLPPGHSQAGCLRDMRESRKKNKGHIASQRWSKGGLSACHKQVWRKSEPRWDPSGSEEVLNAEWLC